MKKLVHPVELAKASHMRPGDPRITLLTEVSGLKKLERFYNAIEDLHDLDFVEGVFKNLELELDVDAADLDNIPKTGGLIFVSNHPYGAIDGLALVQVLGRVRPDLKVMANFLLQQLEPLRDRFIGVNPFEQLTSLSSFQGMRQAMSHVKEGGALAVFPAGEVSSWRTELKAVADPRWKTPMIKLAQHMATPVVPVWFDGANSMVFQMLGMIHPNLRTLALPKEMLRMRGRSVRMRIGKPIPAADIAAFTSTEQLARFLRAKTYSLGSGLVVKRELFNPLRFPRRPKEIAERMAEDRLVMEVEGLADLKLNSQAEFDLYLSPSSRIPNVLREIGRLREATFRAVGEGTNKSIDLDEFDLYYDHLFLWDREKKCLVGAYRIGDGKRIMARYGKRGFYTYTLFRMDRPMDRVLRRSFELGRSFISVDYQRQRLPLFMLWRGLLIHITANPDQQYLIGPVSISGTYSRFSRALIMEFVRQHHYDQDMAASVRPRNRFKIKPDKSDSEVLVQASMADLKKMDRLIAEVDPQETAMPVLLKKYLLLNARIIGFNRDPRFNDALDGLMVLDLQKLPERTIEDLRKGMAEL
ncbi:MAG TPA: lysophospholipid acyltransferase family protein [Flavobacteriales bacterium]|jgi:putative hemolysin|nr:lysophospholipid acyltransferase family protein [Flavobacteriales bacterium]MBK7101504.1 lysophospholipid acyltransferase family protein [Flavobacteriales bacterium]MBK7481784.1 lysophospholipid acyltransferase family protein [Flavobacteriales bacterium]MBK7618768.1 lysophospholipid acyltransferase family protein [Flavobacteriales bacterium]MBK8532404.1 lysophospholipid acyltransferase family protein [Flavobacteriales bacterium]